MATLSLTPAEDGSFCATLVPPQTVDDNISVGKGGYCFVIDISGRCVHPSSTPPLGESPRCASERYEVHL